MRKFYLMLIMIMLISGVSAENIQRKLMSLTDLNVRTSPDLSASVVAVIPARTEMVLIAEQGDVVQISGFYGKWSNVIINENIKGWVFGGLCVPYVNQNKDEIISHFEFTKYIGNRVTWFDNSSGYFVGFDTTSNPEDLLKANYGLIGIGDIGKGVLFDGHTHFVKRTDGGYDCYVYNRLCLSFIIQNDVLTVLYVADETMGSFRSTVVQGKKFTPYRPATRLP